MKYTKKILALLMSFIMLVGMLPMTVIAADEEEYEGAEIVAGGECGLYVDWKLNSLGTLFLERNGSNAATYDYPYDKSSPFRNDSRIKKIVVGEGVVYLGRMVFRDLPNLTEVVLSEGLQEMEFGVFSGCALLTELELPESFNKFSTVAPFYESGIKKLTFKGNNLTTNTEPGYAWDRFFTNADIYVPLPFTLDGTVLSSYEEAAQALGHNDNKVYCVNDNATVKWKDYDGTVLETDENAAQGVIPTFDGETPSRPSDSANAYYFTGWTPEPREVTGDMVYTATYGSYGKASYLDENGEEQETYARPLTGTETELPGGWYVVNQDITYSNELKITGEANLILADGATLNIESGYILNVDETNTLNIYSQKDKSGVLSATTIVAGSVNMYGGNLNVSFMLAAKNVVNIFDGNLNAGYIWAIENGGKIKILGGIVNVEYQLAARENITLGYKNPTDSIYIKNFDDTAPVINIVEGQSFANKDDLSQHYTGTVTAADLKDKKLVPYAHNTITYARSLDGTVTGVSEADYGDEITLSVTPDEGYALDELTVTTEDNRNIELVDNKFIMPATAVTVSATFINTKRYTVKWVIDGEVVETDENIPFGATPEYNGEVPQKAPTAQFTYTFEGWSPAITPVASDITYTAQFGITINSYTVTWVVDGETVETDENVYYGETPEYNGATPTKAEDNDYTYTFNGWTPEVVAATADATYTATFTATPKATPVAEVNGTNYATLAEAIAAAGTGATVTLLDDVTVDSPVVVAAGKDIKLDLDGHSLSGNIADADGKKLIQVSGKLEFVGENGGCIYNTNVAGQGHAACQALTGGTVIVNAPIHFGDSDTDMTNANAVNRGCGIQNNGGTLIINDGYYTSIDANYSAGAWAYAILNCAGDTTVNNATVYGVGLHGALGCEEGTFTVNGGTFAVNGANNYYSLYCNGGDFTVNGGTFTNNGKYGVNYVGTGSSTTITGGDFTYSAKTPFVQSSSVSNPVVSGGTFSTAVPADCCADGFVPASKPNAQGKYTVVHPNNGSNITVANTISDNFYLDDAAYGEDTYVAINYNHASNVSQTPSFSTDVKAMSALPELEGGLWDGNRIISVPVAPAQVTEKITIGIYASEADAEAGTNPIDTIEYSVYDYCRKIITGDYPETLKEVAETTLDYAAAAQTYFGYNTDNMATKDTVGGFYNAVTNVDLSSYRGFAEKASNFKKVTITAKSDLEINFLSNVDFDVTDYSIGTESGVDRFDVSNTGRNGDYYVANVSGLVPANFDEIIRIETGEGNLEFTANTVLEVISRSSNANYATLAKAIFLYGVAANAYFG